MNKKIFFLEGDSPSSTLSSTPPRFENQDWYFKNLWIRQWTPTSFLASAETDWKKIVYISKLITR